MKPIDWLAEGRKAYKEQLKKWALEDDLKAKPSKRMKPSTRNRIITVQRRAKSAHRYRTDVHFRLGMILRGRLLNAIKRQQATKTFQSHVRLLGCTIDQARKHIESQFEPWMTWENHGFRSWHIDHIKPLSAFDLTDPEQVAEACHYTNLQPLDWQENLSKGGVRRPRAG